MFDNIQNLILDFGGVLVDLDRQGWIESFIKLGFNDFEEVFNDKGTNTVFKQFELGQISSEQFCKTLKHHCSAGTTDEQVAEAWNTLLTGIPRQRLRKLLSLRDRYVVYLLSNTNVLHWNHSAQTYFNYHGLTIDDYFEELFLSFQMNQMKPDPGIYHSIIARTGIMPFNTLYLDDMKENCDTAARLGFKTHLVTPDEDWTELFADPIPNYDR